MKIAIPKYMDISAPIKGKISPNGEGNKERGKANKAAITRPTINPINPAPKVLVSKRDNKARTVFNGRVVIKGVIINPIKAPTKEKIAAFSSGEVPLI